MLVDFKNLQKRKDSFNDLSLNFNWIILKLELFVIRNVKTINQIFKLVKQIPITRLTNWIMFKCLCEECVINWVNCKN